MDKVELIEKNEETEVEVTWEDQSYINKFSKLNQRVTFFEMCVQEFKNEKEILEDLENELLLAGGDVEDDDDEDKPAGIGGEYTIPFKIGDSFVCMTSDEAQEHIDLRKEELEKMIEENENKLDEVNSEMTDLKAKLYGKFGKSINLER